MALAALPDDADINASTTVTKLVGFAPGMPISFKRHNYNFISERLWNKKIYKLSYAIGLWSKMQVLSGEAETMGGERELSNIS